MQTPNEEYGGQNHLTDQLLPQLLEKVDADLAEKVAAGGCRHCAGKLHRANYPRKPRAGPDHWDQRHSFCCDRDGCRKRHTPPSVRFLGRKVYVALVVVLVSAMRHGLKPERVQILRESLGIDRRTLERWRQWWLETFASSTFWKAARSRFMPLLGEQTLPWSLWQAFRADRREGFLKLLEFLAPITTTSIPADRAG